MSRGEIQLRDPVLGQFNKNQLIYIGYATGNIPKHWFHISLDEILLNREGFYIDNFLAKSS